MSLDGYIDDSTEHRLIISDDADLDRVDAVRAGCDAILVGAGTVRTDNPRLLVRSAERRAERVARGKPGSPLRVTITGSGDLDPAARIFSTPGADSLAYCPSEALPRVGARVGAAATAVGAGPTIDLAAVLADLGARGVGRLLVEGGTGMYTQLLSDGLADELQLIIAPFLLGDAAAPRFVDPAAFPYPPGKSLRLAEVRRLNDLVLLRYLAGSSL